MRRQARASKQKDSARTSRPREADGAPEFRFAGLDEVLGYHVRRAHGAVRRTYKAEMASLRMTQKQTAVMWLIEQNPGISQVSICNALGMDRATTAELIDRLQGRGLVARQPSDVDARCWALSATTSGKRLMTRVRARVAQHEQRLLALFSPTELKLFRELLDRLESLDGSLDADDD